MPLIEHHSHEGVNNRTENGHQPTRQRERSMEGFRDVGGAQRFPSTFSGISPRSRPRRHLMTASGYRAEMTVRFAIWDQITGAAGSPTRALRTRPAPRAHHAPTRRQAVTHPST
ncbi:hypothetical protein SUDANB58_05676 [Streptomyces sp. enrichment culture]